MPTLIIAQIGVGKAVHDIEANFKMTETLPTVSSKMEIRTPTTESMLSMPLHGGIAIRVDTRKHMYDVSLPPVHSPHKKGDNGYPYDIGHNSASSKETFASREVYNNRFRYNPTCPQELGQGDPRHNFEFHRDGEVVDLPRDVEKDPYYEAELTNGSVLDYVLREDVGDEVVPWEDNGDNRTPLPRRHGSARLKKPKPIRSNSKD
jgi:hypothetical protein